MCLAIPGKVIEIDNSGSLKMGKVDFGGVRKDVCLEYLPEISVGEYVIVHVGFAISKMDEQEAAATLKLIDQIGELSSDEPEAGDP